MNMTRTAMLIALMTVMFMSVGYLLGGGSGMMIALAFAVATNLFGYWNSDKMVLRMYNAQEVDERSAPEYVAIVRGLAANSTVTDAYTQPGRNVSASLTARF